MDELTGIVEIAQKVDAWVLCDEVYRHLTQTDDWCPSIADLYEKGLLTKYEFDRKKKELLFNND